MMKTIPTPRVLLVGRADDREFRAAGGELRRWAEVVDAPDGRAALAAVEQDAAGCDLVVLAQRYPGEFSHELVDRLRRAVPLAPVVGLLGSWCEGEARSGRPWPGVARVYWRQWPASCRRELARLSAGQGSTWTLPATATDEERLLAERACVRRRAGLVPIVTASAAMHEWLAETLRRRGHATAWLRPGEPVRVEGAVAALLDAAEMDSQQTAIVRHLCQALAPAPVIALLDFPRVEDDARARTAGAAAVLSKPLAIEDLDDALEQVLDGREGGTF
ncbi:MAG: hypothetical protein JW809_14020 [Pirellulales bacterium]|nr:hypothetical protein [Pirellulales bacterium]